LGSKGIISKRKRNHTNASDKIDKVMDSTGAGDAFGRILFAYIKEKTIDECLISL
jgi:sugar/nucleoside kinase (ribokinase family)